MLPDLGIVKVLIKGPVTGLKLETQFSKGVLMGIGSNSKIGQDLVYRSGGTIYARSHYVNEKKYYSYPYLMN